MTKPELVGFSVDTHLFRELGALLVGRDSTALVELIKNSYDADASRVVIRGEGLSRGQGSITVSDDGIGMTFDEFKDGFLRIASRTREQGDRRSLRYGRRYTGAKGVGRLSAHKLAALLHVTSSPDLQMKQLREATGVDAVIDWDVIETHETLEQASRDVTLVKVPIDGSEPGTVIRLDRLRRRWTDRALATFLAELEAFRPPPPLVEPLAEGIAAGPFLFTAPRVRSSLSGKAAAGKAADPGFDIVAEGDFASGDDYWDRVAGRANWLIEVEARRTGVTAVIAPTARGPVSGRTEPQRFEWNHPAPKDGPFFDARLLIREGVIGPTKDPVADFTRRVAGVRVYMEGFRVLPYGSPGDDWLDLDRDYARRTRELEIPEQIGAGVAKFAGSYNGKEQATSLTAAGGGTATTFAYADLGNAERASSTTSGTTTTFVNGLLGLSAQTVGSGTTQYFTRDPNGGLISMRSGAGSGGTSYYYITDRLGSVINMTDSAGTTDVATYTYDAYGQTTTTSGTQATVNPWRFAGGYYDGNTTLTKFGARYYDATTGRWTQADPSNSPSNRYVYADDDPVDRVDLTGLSTCGDISFGGLVDCLSKKHTSVKDDLKSIFGAGKSLVQNGLACVKIAKYGLVLGGAAGVPFEVPEFTAPAGAAAGCAVGVYYRNNGPGNSNLINGLP